MVMEIWTKSEYRPGVVMSLSVKTRGVSFQLQPHLLIPDTLTLELTLVIMIEMAISIFLSRTMGILLERWPSIAYIGTMVETIFRWYGKASSSIILMMEGSSTSIMMACWILYFLRATNFQILS